MSATTKAHPGPEASVVPGRSSLLEGCLQDSHAADCTLPRGSEAGPGLEHEETALYICNSLLCQVISWDPDKWLSHIRPVFKL